MVPDWLMSSGFLEQQNECDRPGRNPVCKMWQMRDGCFHLEAFYFQVLRGGGTVIKILSPLHCTAFMRLCFSFFFLFFLPKLLWDTSRQDSHSFQQFKKRESEQKKEKKSTTTKKKRFFNATQHNIVCVISQKLGREAFESKPSMTWNKERKRPTCEG